MDAEMKAWAKEQAEFCSVFSNAKRVMIFWSVLKREKSVSEIAQDIEASLQSTSQHLHLMKERSILESRRQGQTIYYRPAKNELLRRCALFSPPRRRSFKKEPKKLITVGQ